MLESRFASRTMLSLLLILPFAPALAQEVLVKDLGKAVFTDRSFRPYLSPNGERVAYVMRSDNTSTLVCDGKEGPVWDNILYVGISTASPFSDDGKHLPYQGKKGNDMFLLFAGEEDKALSTPSAQYAVYTPDGAHYAYTVNSLNQQWIVLDGKEQPHYKRVTPSGFSPDGKRFAYTATDENNKVFMVVDGQPLQAYEKASYVAFSPDGKRLAYIGVRDGKPRIVCDGKEGKPYPEAFYPLFSPDGKSLAYWARSADRKTHSVIWDDKELAQMPGEPRLAFSPDSRTLACGTYSGEMYRFGEKNERLATGFDAASMPVFSPDSRHIAYTIGKDLKWRICVDGKSLLGRFDPQNILHWDGVRGGGMRMILDAPGWSADGKHVFAKGFRGQVVNAVQGVRQHFIVCDGIEGPPHDDLWIPLNFQTNAKALRYVVLDGDRLRLMEWPWPKDKTWQDALEKENPMITSIQRGASAETM